MKVVEYNVETSFRCVCVREAECDDSVLMQFT